MSMNLHVSFDGHPFSLWQTPTFITNMCLYSDDEIQWEVKGKPAIRAINMYIEWVKHQLNGVWDSTEDYEEQKEFVNDHIKSLQDNIKNTPPKRIVVYQM